MTAKKATATQIPLVLVRLIRCWGGSGGGAAAGGAAGGAACGGGAGSGWAGAGWACSGGAACRGGTCGGSSTAGWFEGASPGVAAARGSVVIGRPLAFSSFVSPFLARQTRCYAYRVSHVGAGALSAVSGVIAPDTADKA